MNNYIVLVIPIIKSIAFALVLGIIGWILIKWINSRVEKLLIKSKIDENLKPYITSLSRISLKLLLGLAIVGILGIDTTSVAAVIAAAGFAVGLAFQGTLSNFAGGILLLTVRQFKVGDYIEAEGYDGTVQAIQLLYTELVTLDNKVIYIPNGNLSNASVVNYSTKDTRRVDMNFSVAYQVDSNKVIFVLKELLNSHPLVKKDPEPFVRLTEHGDSSLIFTVRAWVNTLDYFTVYFDMMENVKKRFDEEKIEIPYPQMDVHLNNMNGVN